MGHLERLALGLAARIRWARARRALPVLVAARVEALPLSLVTPGTAGPGDGDVWGLGGRDAADIPPMPAWAPLASGPGLWVRNTSRAYAVPATRRWSVDAGRVAASLGGVFNVADVSGSSPGPFPPHASHQGGADIDVGYTLAPKLYPTPVGVPASDGFALLLSVLASAVEVVGVSAARVAELEASAVKLGLVLPKLAVWPGHSTHAHVRLRS